MPETTGPVITQTTTDSPAGSVRVDQTPQYRRQWELGGWAGDAGQHRWELRGWTGNTGQYSGTCEGARGHGTASGFKEILSRVMKIF